MHVGSCRICFFFSTVYIVSLVLTFCICTNVYIVIYFWQEIAEYYESDEMFEQAIAYYETAAEFFQIEEVTTSANQCNLKVAQYASQLEQ